MRAEFQRENAAALAELSDLGMEILRNREQLTAIIRAALPSKDAVPEPSFEPTDEMKALSSKLNELERDYNLIESEKLVPLWIKRTLLSVTGGGMDGTTADDLAEFGPDTLVAEIVLAIGQCREMTPDEIQAFWLPSTSGAQADGEMKTGSAPPVETAAFTSIAIAGNIPISPI
jgi:hypothetical protein